MPGQVDRQETRMSRTREHPFHDDEDGSALNVEALDRVGDRIRHPDEPDQRYRDGSFAVGNTAAMTHGGEARKTRARKRKEKAAELRKQYAGPDGSLDPAVGMVLEAIAGVMSVSDIALSYVEKSSHSLGSGKVERGVDVYLNSVQAQARLLALLATMTPAKSLRGYVPPFRVIHGDGPVMVVDELTATDVNQIKALREGDDEKVISRLEPPAGTGQRGLVIERVSTRKEMLEAVGQVDEDNEPVTVPEPEPALLTPTPSRPVKAAVGSSWIERVL